MSHLPWEKNIQNIYKTQAVENQTIPGIYQTLLVI